MESYYCNNDRETRNMAYMKMAFNYFIDSIANYFAKVFTLNKLQSIWIS